MNANSSPMYASAPDFPLHNELPVEGSPMYSSAPDSPLHNELPAEGSPETPKGSNEMRRLRTKGLYCLTYYVGPMIAVLAVAYGGLRLFKQYRTA